MRWSRAQGEQAGRVSSHWLAGCQPRQLACKQKRGGKSTHLLLLLATSVAAAACWDARHGSACFGAMRGNVPSPYRRPRWGGTAVAAWLGETRHCALVRDTLVDVWPSSPRMRYERQPREVAAPRTWHSLLGRTFPCSLRQSRQSGAFGLSGTSANHGKFLSSPDCNRQILG